MNIQNRFLMNCRNVILLMVLGSITTGYGYAQRQASSESSTKSPQLAGVNQRGDHVMGFSHEKTSHHFCLYPDGGEIEVLAGDSKDTASRDQIRSHLLHITRMFAAGNFNAPMLIHGRNPPGEPTLKRLKESVHYKFEEKDRGGAVRIRTENQEALKAVHGFLRFQITEHQTGDSLHVTERKR